MILGFPRQGKLNFMGALDLAWDLGFQQTMVEVGSRIVSGRYSHKRTDYECSSGREQIT